MHPDIRVRRMRTLLYTSGIGTLIFALWGVARMLLLFTIGENSLLSDIWESTLEFIVVAVSVALMMAIDFFLRAKVAYSAMAVGKGKKRRSGYLFLAGLLCILNLTSWSVPFLLGDAYEWGLEVICALLLETTANVILIEVIVFSLRLKVLEARHAD